MAALVDIGGMIVSTPGVNGGRPCIAGTGISVGAIGLLWQEPLTPQEIVAAVYPHLTLAQVYAALAFYHLNREAIDAEIEADVRAFEEGLAEQQARDAQ
jgi:uncharacterized protein (DUF433 family)